MIGIYQKMIYDNWLMICRAKRSFIDGCQFVMLLYDISRVETFNNVAKR